MLILSQKKDEIVNLDNVVNFRLGYNGNFIVRAENHEKVCELGEYATEERAKEVLQEIIKCYRSYLQLNGGPAILQGQMDIQPNIFNIPKVYEMPEK